MLSRIGLGRVLPALVSVTALVGVTPVAPAQSASAPFAFEQTQSRHGGPVGWNPCRAIPVRMNLSHAPRGSGLLLRQALADIQSATGIRMVLAGRSHRSSGMLRHYGVLVSWTTPGHVHDLAGATVGIGATSWRQVSGGRRHYTRGAALLDAPALRRMGPATRLAVLEHELGHVMGLAHVRDPHQLMYPRIHGQHGLQAGDRAGLAVLGQQPCG